MVTFIFPDLPRSFYRYQLRLFSLLILLGCQPTQAIADSSASYPVPIETQNRLFYLQRSTNANTVVYDANILENGLLDPKQPVRAYWIRYASRGQRKDLNFLERNFAYGVKAKKTGKNTYRIRLKAYSGRDIEITTNKTGKAIAITKIQDQMARLKHIYLDVSGSGLGINVNYIDLIGVGIKNGQALKERFDPNGR